MLFGLGKPDVPKLKAKGDLKGLVNALGYKGDGAIQWSAVEALSETGSLALEYLESLGRWPSDALSWGIGCVLGEMARKASDPALRLRAFNRLVTTGPYTSTTWYITNLALYSDDEELQRSALNVMKPSFRADGTYDTMVRTRGARNSILNSLAEQVNPAMEMRLLPEILDLMSNVEGEDELLAAKTVFEKLSSRSDAVDLLTPLYQQVVHILLAWAVDGSVLLGLTKAIYAGSADQEVRKAIRDDLLSYLSNFVHGFRGTTAALTWEDLSSMGIDIVEPLVDLHDGSLFGFHVIPDAPGNVRTREVCTVELAKLCRTDAGLDRLLDILKDKSGKGAVLAARVLSLQDGEFFDSMKGDRRRFVLERMRELVGMRKSREYADKVLRRLGDKMTVDRVKQERKQEILEKDRSSAHFMFGERMGDRQGKCNNCGKWVPLREAAYRLSFEHLDHWTNADVLAYYCPDCFDDNQDHPGYMEHGRLVDGGRDIVDTIERSTSR